MGDAREAVEETRLNAFSRSRGERGGKGGPEKKRMELERPFIPVKGSQGSAEKKRGEKGTRGEKIWIDWNTTNLGKFNENNKEKQRVKKKDSRQKN